MASLVDELHKIRVVPTRDPKKGYQEDRHRVQDSHEESTPAMAVRYNRALQDKRSMKPGPGRWVEYVLPDLRRVYVESNLRKMYLGRMDDSAVVARVIIKPGGTEYTTDLYGLLMMRMVEVSGDLRDVVRTADKVGLYVSDPETRSQKDLTKDLQGVRTKIAGGIAVSLIKEAYYDGYDTMRHLVTNAADYAQAREEARLAAHQIREREQTKRQAIEADPKGYYQHQKEKREEARKQHILNLKRTVDGPDPDRSKITRRGRNTGAAYGALAGALPAVALAGHKHPGKAMAALAAGTAVGAGLGHLSGAKRHREIMKKRRSAAQELRLRGEK